MQVGMHRITLREGSTAEDFERLMAEEVFPAAAETPGSVSRGGRSAIKSQHLLRADGEYLWLVKGSGVFSDHLFARIFTRMYDEAREKLEPLGTRSSSLVWTSVASLEIGPRDQLGRPTGQPVRGTDL